MEAIYERVPGVSDVVSGFAGGTQSNPSYESHGSHTETVEITYDPEKVTYEKLVRIFYTSHDPANARGVAPDFGPSYRPALFYRTPNELATIERVKADVQKGLKKPVATQIVPFEKFWPADAYHQDFVRRNPDQSYVRNVSLPRVKETLGQQAAGDPRPDQRE